MGLLDALTPRAASLLGAALLLTASCSPGEETLSLRFVAQVNGAPFACDARYEGVGSPGTAVNPVDLRLYVHGVTLVRAGGERVPLALTPDGLWQSDTVALLDFERRIGTCQGGSDETNALVVGAAPDHDDYVGLEFTLGVPLEENHLDQATAEAPLNVAGMWWSWEAGYRFLRVEVDVPANERFVFHLGSTGCSGTPPDDFTCNHENLVTIALDDFDPRADAVVLDVGALLAGSDLAHVNDKDEDPVTGCMSSLDDPQCPALTAPLGLAFGGGGPTESPQTVFRVEPGGAAQ